MRPCRPLEAAAVRNYNMSWKQKAAFFLQARYRPERGKATITARNRQQKGGVTMTYSEFCEIVRQWIASGEIKTTAELYELDIAIQYAIGQEMQERGGGELQTTAEEIYFLIGKHCGEDVQSRVFSN